jgi:hypothetical protein
METILDNGVTYVKATALAKKYRYTTDYIGQLCRSGKVDAKLIGRAWFVNEASINNHKSDRYSAVRSSEKMINKSLVSDRAVHPVALRREVRPVLSKSAHRSILQTAEPKTYNFEARGAARVSTYHQDNEMLEPATTPHKVVVTPEITEPENDGKTHKISVSLGEKASRKLAFEELPEVTLRGDLTVDSLDDPEFFAEVEPVRSEQIQFAPQSITKPAVIVTKRYQPTVAPIRQRYVAPEVEMAYEEEVESEVVALPNKNIAREKRAVVETKKSPVRFVIVPVFIGVAVVLSGLSLGLVSHTETDGLQLRQSLKFSMAAAIESVSELTKSY